jgi:NADP-dependent 3-hydroxy acid dehydrogenase YdfG
LYYRAVNICILKPIFAVKLLSLYISMAKTIVVTGCTKGIGLAVATTFANMGFNVAGCARNASDLSGLQQLLEQINPDAVHTLVKCDVSNADEIRSFVEKVNAAYPRIDVLVNNAGVFLPGRIADEKENTLEHLLATNVTSAYKITRALLPGMISAKSGSVFNICSIASLQAYEGGGSYSISKFALLGFSKQLRHEMKPHNIKVTAVMPGATLTDSWAGSNLPEHRFIKPADIANAIKGIYELSDYADVEEIVIRPVEGDI